MAGNQGSWGDSAKPSKTEWSVKAVDKVAEEKWVSLAGEEEEIQDGTRVFWRFSRCGRSYTENQVENEEWADGYRVSCE